MGISYEQLGKMASEADVAGLTQAFSLAGDWDTRETVMVAFGNMLRDHRGNTAIEQTARSSLQDILSLCKAESSGGSYRENCIGTAERLLASLETNGG